MLSTIKRARRQRRHNRIRAKVSGTKEIPRFSVFKSNTRIIAQVINDENAKTLVYVSTSDFKKGTPKERAEEAGKKIAQDAKRKKIEKVVFDRGGFLYAGNIEVLANSAREEGLKF